MRRGRRLSVQEFANAAQRLRKVFEQRFDVPTSATEARQALGLATELQEAYNEPFSAIAVALGGQDVDAFGRPCAPFGGTMAALHLFEEHVAAGWRRVSLNVEWQSIRRDPRVERFRQVILRDALAAYYVRRLTKPWSIRAASREVLPGFTFDGMSRHWTFLNRPIARETQAEGRLLTTLLDNFGRVASFDNLVDARESGRFGARYGSIRAADDVLKTRISDLRRRLRAAEVPFTIESVNRLGYRVACLAAPAPRAGTKRM